MSRNGSGTYNLPAGNPVVSGTTISSTWANNTLTDIATALTNSLASDGQTVATGNLQMGNYKITNLANGTTAGDATTYGQLIAVPFLQNGTGAVATTVQTKLKEYVSVKDFGAVGNGTTDDTTAIQNAVNSGALSIDLSYPCAITNTITLNSNQTFNFNGGSLILKSGSTPTNGILYANGKSNINIINPVIDCSAVSSVNAGINLIDSPNCIVNGGILTKCNITLSSTNNAVVMNYKVLNTFLNLASISTSAIYISNVNTAEINGVEIKSGLEGVGIYNASTNIKHIGCSSYSHTQDGFVIINGNNISYVGCIAYSNGQAGFTTQRQTAYTDCRFITYSSCIAKNNSVDGFDLRGATTTPFVKNMLMTLSSCIAQGNSGTGFYIVNAEAVTLTGCVAQNNLLQGFFVNTSINTQLVGCRSASNASSVAAGVNKAGIIIYNSNNCTVAGCDSTNSDGATQNYGISFTGTSGDGSVVGGFYQNNSTSWGYINTSASVCGAINQDTGNVWTDTICVATGAYSETGFGSPSHTRPKGSLFRRTDGTNGEMYMSNGAGSWTQITIP